MEKMKFKSGISAVGNQPSMASLRDLAKSDPKGWYPKIESLVEKGILRLEDIKDLKGLYQTLAPVQIPVVVDQGGFQRAVMASAFPILTGTLAIKSINAAYAAVVSIGQQLVTEIEDNKKVTSIAAISALDSDIPQVKEADDFPEISATEEKVEIRHRRNGRKLSITAEAIEENELADIITRINALGQIANEWVEEQTLARVTDHFGSAASPADPYVYRPNGTGTQLYSATADTPGVRAPSGTRIETNAFVDDTDLKGARDVLVAMKNNRGKKIGLNWSEVQLLCPDGIVDKVAKVFNSEYVPGVINEKSNYGPGGRFTLPADRIISSAKMDDLSATAWYLGAFRRQFTRKWKLRMEYVTLGMDTQAYLNSRIAFQARIAWDVEVGATDYVYVVQCIDGTTAPADE